MKKSTLIAFTIFASVWATSSNAQQSQQTSAPHAFKYQAVARDASGNPLTNQNVSFRISILQGSATGAAVYQETQTTTTNQFGLSNLEIGMGNVVSGSFDSIQWGNGTYFVKIEMDASGGTNYALMGTSQMLSVPYSLYAENAGNVQGFPAKAALQATNLAAPLNNPETGMLVYNTTAAGEAPYNVTPGYYYNAGTPEQPEWVALGGSAPKNRNNRHSADTGSGTSSSDTTKGGPLTPGVGNTTEGGYYQDLSQEKITSAPTGNYNTGFGTNTFGGGTNPSGSNNTCTGYEASYSITGAWGTTANGYEALYNNTTDGATVMGDSAAYSNTTGVGMTAFGFHAAAVSQTAQYLTAFGFKALSNNNNSGVNNAAFGDFALSTNSTGVDNLGAGFNAADNNTSGSYNTALGSAAMYYNTTGDYNTVTGFYAMKGVSGSSTGSYNTANGYETMYGNTIGEYNTASGASALYNNTAASQNTALGYEALYTQSYSSSSPWASDNVAVGYQSLYNNQPTSTTTGYENTAVGDYSLKTNTVGSNLTVIGYKADVGTASGLVYATALGSGAIVSGSNCMALGGQSLTNYEFVGIAEAHPLADLVIADADSSTSSPNTNNHIKSEGATPGWTTSYTGTVTLTGSSTDVVGNVSISAGAISGAGTITVNFIKNYNLPPIVVLTPTTADGAALAPFVYVTSTINTFVIHITGTPNGVATDGAWNYHVIEPN